MLTIGPVRIGRPLLLAPMAGATDPPFRLICKEFGAGLVCGEMISDQALLHGNHRTLPLLYVDPAERPASLQLFGARPETLAKAAAILTRHGPDLIDLNFGCPMPKIIKNKAGSALLLDIPRAEAIVQAVVAATPLPVTVKIRSGWDAQHIVAPELAAVCEAAGAKAITVHGRTREQLYSGRADWEVIRAVKQAVKIPVIGNGDIHSATDARRMMAETGCDAVAVGRGALGNPWVFAAARTPADPDYRPSIGERFDVMRRHYLAEVEFSGSERGVKEMRKHLGWYLKGLPGASRIRVRLNSLDRPEDVLAALNEYEFALGDKPVPGGDADHGTGD